MTPEEIAAELDVIGSWHNGERSQKIQDLKDAVLGKTAEVEGQLPLETVDSVPSA